MRSLIACLAFAGIAFVAVGIAPDTARADVDCSDFSTQAQAQSFFLNHGGPSSDPNGLDADHDGIACEALPCPCAGSGGGGGGGHPGHKKKHRQRVEVKRRPGPVFIYPRCTKGIRAFEPPTITLACADLILRLEQLTWTGWDSRIAYAQGVLTYPSCPATDPTAVCKMQASFPATVSLFRPRYCTKQKHNYFTRVHWVASGANPGVADLTLPFPCKYNY